MTTWMNNKQAIKAGLIKANEYHPNRWYGVKAGKVTVFVDGLGGNIHRTRTYYSHCACCGAPVVGRSYDLADIQSKSESHVCK